MHYEEFVHFAIFLKESKLINLRFLYREVNPDLKFDPFTDQEYYSTLTDYALTFCAKNPVESAYYLKLIYPERSPELKQNKNLVVTTAADFIINNNQIGMIFDNISLVKSYL